MQHIEVKINRPVATVLIGRRERRGALDPVLIQDLKQALDDIHLEPKVRGVIVTGAGEYFCSGLDLSVMRRIHELPDEQASGQWFTLWREWTELVEQMLRFPKPLVAAVDGIAAGAGMALALAADILVCSERARLIASAPRYGLIGGATTTLLNFRCGGSVAARYSLASQAIDAFEAQHLGLCEEPVTSDQVWVRSQAWIEKIARGSPESIAATKRLLNETVGEELVTHLSAAAAASATLSGTESASEGVRAFAEKREPKFS
ncbi:MAG: enoyl-CoA hydratase/isomerase family protein [Planctomycetota bacterium]